MTFIKTNKQKIITFIVVIITTLFVIACPNDGGVINNIQNTPNNENEVNPFTEVGIVFTIDNDDRRAEIIKANPPSQVDNIVRIVLPFGAETPTNARIEAIELPPGFKSDKIEDHDYDLSKTDDLKITITDDKDIATEYKVEVLDAPNEPLPITTYRTSDNNIDYTVNQANFLEDTVVLTVAGIEAGEVFTWNFNNKTGQKESIEDSKKEGFGLLELTKKDLQEALTGISAGAHEFTLSITTFNNEVKTSEATNIEYLVLSDAARLIALELDLGTSKRTLEIVETDNAGTLTYVAQKKLPFGVILPTQVSISHMEISNEASADKKVGDTIDVTQAASVVVTAEDQTNVRTYSIDIQETPTDTPLPHTTYLSSGGIDSSVADLDNDEEVIVIQGLEKDMEFTWSFNNQTGTKTAELNGTLVLTKEDLTAALTGLTQGDYDLVISFGTGNDARANTIPISYVQLSADKSLKTLILTINGEDKVMTITEPTPTQNGKVETTMSFGHIISTATVKTIITTGASVDRAQNDIITIGTPAPTITVTAADSTTVVYDISINEAPQTAFAFTTYRTDGSLDLSVTKSSFADDTTVLTITGGLRPSTNFTWSFNSQTGSKTSTTDGTLILTKADFGAQALNLTAATNNFTLSFTEGQGTNAVTKTSAAIPITYIIPSADKDITNFEAEIDGVNAVFSVVDGNTPSVRATISRVFGSQTPTTIKPITIVISDKASSNVVVGTDTNTNTNIVVTAEDGSTKNYSIEIATSHVDPQIRTYSHLLDGDGTNSDPALDFELRQAVKDVLFGADETVVEINNVKENIEYTWSWTLGQDTPVTGTKPASGNRFVLTKSELSSAITGLKNDDQEQQVITFAVSFVDASVTPTVSHNKELSLIYKPGDIHTWRDLQAMRINLNRNYNLENDISFDFNNDNQASADDYVNIPNYDGFAPIGNEADAFTGTFQGNNKKIESLYINKQGDYAGLFGGVESTDGKIINVHLHNANIQGVDLVGGLTGIALSGATVTGSVTDSVVKGVIVLDTPRGVGGLVGRAETSSIIGFIKNSVVESDTQGRAGGLVGLAKSGSTIIGYALENQVSGYYEIGGLVGILEESSLTGYVTGNVTGKRSDSSDVGGLVGRVIGSNKASGSGSQIAGYSTAAVNSTHNDTGGFIGRFSFNKKDEASKLTGYWDIASSGKTTSGNIRTRTTAQENMVNLVGISDIANVTFANNIYTDTDTSTQVFTRLPAPIWELPGASNTYLKLSKNSLGDSQLLYDGQN